MVGRWNRMYFVYLLKSQTNGSFYIGITSDVERRLKEHNSGKTYYTDRHRPYELIYFEAYRTKSSAEEREKNLKRFGSAYYGLLKRLGDKS